mgnify:CR=1 FL=1
MLLSALSVKGCTIVQKVLVQVVAGKLDLV